MDSAPPEVYEKLQPRTTNVDVPDTVSFDRLLDLLPAEESMPRMMERKFGVDFLEDVDANNFG